MKSIVGFEKVFAHMSSKTVFRTQSNIYNGGKSATLQISYTLVTSTYLVAINSAVQNKYFSIEYDLPSTSHLANLASSVSCLMKTFADIPHPRLPCLV